MRIAWLALLLVACAPVDSAPLPTTPTGTCDVRMQDHNARECRSRGGVFTVPTDRPCGVCAVIQTR